MKKLTFTNNDEFNKNFRELSILDHYRLENLLGILNRVSPKMCAQFQNEMVDYIAHDYIFFYYVEVVLDYDKAIKDLTHKLKHICA